MKFQPTHRAGFTLIELMIVCAVILVIAAIAIPSLMRSRMAANESSAITAVRTIVTGEIGYRVAGHSGGDYGTLNELHDPNGTGDEGFIDETLESGFKHGYEYILVPTPAGPATPPTYTLNANPTSYGETGVRHFFADHNGFIRVSNQPPAGPDDEPL